MSLAQAVLDVAEAMEKEGSTADPTDADQLAVARVLRSFARELRTAVKAAESPNVVSADDMLKLQNWMQLQPCPTTPPKQGLLIPSHSNPGVPKPEEPKEGGERMVLCVHGSFYGDLIAVPNDMQPGQCVPVCDQEIYQLKEDGKLHFSAKETQRYQQQKGK